MKHPLVLLCAAVLSGTLCGLPEVPVIWKMATVLIMSAAVCFTGIKCRGYTKPLHFLITISCLLLGLTGFSRSKTLACAYQTGDAGLFFEDYKATNPGQFDYSIYLKAKGITCEEERKTAQEASTPLQTLAAQIIDDHVSSGDSGVFRAMLTGDKTDLEDSLQTLYQKNGISHLLAVSGLHVGLVGALLQLISVKILHLGRKSSFLLTGLFAALYALMTGGSASSIRAAFMFISGSAAAIWGRTYDPLTALALIAAILSFRHPYLLLQSGFQLSFTAVLGILAVRQLPSEKPSNCCNRKNDLVRKLRSSALSSLSVTLSTLPPLLHSYYQAAPCSFLLNLAVIPLMTVIMFSSFGVLLFGAAERCSETYTFLSSLFRFFSVASAAPGHYVLKLYSFLCELVQKLPFANITVGKPADLCILLFYLFLFILFYILKRRKERKGSCVLLFGFFLLSLGFLGIKSSNQASVTVLDVGQGDCFHIHYSDMDIVIDCGSSGYERAGSRILKPYLLSQGITQLDAVIVSHADSDHINGILYLLEEDDSVQIDQVFLPYLAQQDEKYDHLINIAASYGCRVSYLHTGSALSCDGMKLNCIYAETDPSATEETNRESDVLLLECPGLKMLFTGDITEEEEKKILQLYEGTVLLDDIDVLKCAHHGSATANSEEWLSKIKPDVAVLSYGKGNRYGHPASEVVSRLQRVQTAVWSTAEQGAGQILPDTGKGVKIVTVR